MFPRLPAQVFPRRRCCALWRQGLAENHTVRHKICYKNFRQSNLGMRRLDLSPSMTHVEMTSSCFLG